MAVQRKLLGDILLENGLITKNQLEDALAEQKTSRDKLGRILVRKGFISEQQLMEVLEFSLGIPQVQLNRVKIDPDVVRLLPTSLIRKHY
ncbi:MAG: type II secretion system protein GspE, partial [Syntrophomonadaceae bacterium]